MAFNKAKFGSKNPTGDKAFNAITKNVFGPDMQGESPNSEQSDASAPTAAPKGKGKAKKNSYDCSTNSFRSM